jgi:flagellin
LSDGSLSDAQRQTYTANLKSQIDEVQTFITSSSYNGVNLIGSNQGTFAVSAGGASNFSAPTNVSVLSGLNGQALTIHASNLFGGTAGTDGFLGLARLVYNVGSATNATLNTAADTNSNAVLIAGAGGLSSRSEISQNEALAALAAISVSASAFQSVSGGTGTTSVFGASLANFTTQVNNALGSLGADNANIQLQITFVQSLSNAANTGLGNLVDADLAQASAQLTALQTQQQLATQALSIANSQPQNILNLFKNS